MKRIAKKKKTTHNIFLGEGVVAQTKKKINIADYCLGFISLLLKGENSAKSVSAMIKLVCLLELVIFILWRKNISQNLLKRLQYNLILITLPKDFAKS